ncbi:rna-directed dna polymerase from mobile element jockey-like [Limosa lapponica baueri]|uniref:Rna-directed dna polymerase from mobile element jockey-like n=1 Tax=Limosa lapponica baueri TaxID=1758121 RepID=A0A2I0UDA1_LIMLA|nr:rna-directed dna polymerase from mobile element jockey-like [Limosa lapponica baueri]
MEQILLESLLRHMANKDIIGDNQHGCTKSKLCLKNLVAFYDGVIVLVDKVRATGIIYLDLCKAFDTMPRDILVSKSLERRGFNRWIVWMIMGFGCTLSKFADNTKLCGAVDTLEGRDAIQRDLDRLERWAPANLMKFNQAKCKELNMGCDNPKHKYKLSREWIDSSPEECTCNSESQLHPGLHQKKRGQQAEGCDSSPLLCSCETSVGVLCPTLGSPI